MHFNSCTGRLTDMSDMLWMDTSSVKFSVNFVSDGKQNGSEIK